MESLIFICLILSFGTHFLLKIVAMHRITIYMRKKRVGVNCVVGFRELSSGKLVGALINYRPCIQGGDRFFRTARGGPEMSAAVKALDVSQRGLAINDTADSIQPLVDPIRIDKPSQKGAK